MPSSLILPQSLYQALVAHAQEQWPQEACGLLRGRAGRATAFLPAANVAAQPRTDYQVDPQALLQALDWEDQGDELIAIFHSHPTSPAIPSPVDVARALYPDSVYLILSLQDRSHPHLQGYFLRPEAILIDPTAQALRQALPFRQVRAGLWAYPLDVRESRPFPSHYFTYQDPSGPVRLMHIQPVEILLSIPF